MSLSLNLNLELSSQSPCPAFLVDVNAFLDSELLRVVEYPPVLGSQDEMVDLSSHPLPPFAAISYPWRDLQLPKGRLAPSFSVSGALHADPISISVLRTACIGARAYGCALLWLDRLCIMQSSKVDKIWQIQRMFYLYRCCTICLVFPGGLVRLARLDDTTSWIDRAWTLQEAVVPGEKKTKFVYKLTHPSYRDFLQRRCEEEDYPESFRDNILTPPDVNNTTHGQFTEQILEPGESAAAELTGMLRDTQVMLGRLRLHAPAMARNRPDNLPVRIFRMPEAQLLYKVLRTRKATALTLWIAAYTRSSSRPVDMVFSVMGLLGVHLDVARFQTDDRTRATIAVIQAVMQGGHGYATWLFIAPEMDSCRELSTLPEMPETSVGGRAYIHMRKGRVPAVEAIGVKG
ncbi:hypothetical protein C8Q74DRAFT_1371105 [Fomes fomentarius]|nr:hypothetical protein C8Q74DRAFT_1371105 [Fomes fomentarius]